MSIVRQKQLSLFIFIASLVATLGSLYFSEIMGLLPCKLCWYQRIAMYPIVAISLVGILRRSSELHWYVLPLGVIGTLIAGYHYVLQKFTAVVPAAAIPCAVNGVSCTRVDLEYLGFITVPLLSFVGFIVITIAAVVSIARTPRPERSTPAE